MTRQSPSRRVLPPLWILIPPFVLAVGRAVAAAGPESEPITSVAVGSRTVFAVTRSGFHQGSLESRAWAAATVPVSMARGGAVVGDPDGELYGWTVPGVVLESVSPGMHVGASARTAADGEAEFACHRRRGVGGPWERVSNESIDQLLVVGTHLFAIARAVPGGANTQRVLRSADGGRFWADLTPREGFGLMLLGMRPDPDHPGQACLLGNGIRNYILQSPDGSRRWDTERELAWHRNRMAKDPFAEPGADPGVPVVTATLGTYFRHGFGNSPKAPVLGLEVGGARSFPAGGTAVVVVRVLHRGVVGSGAALSVVDLMDGTSMWGLNRVTPSGKAEVFGPPADTAGAALRASRDWTADPVPSGGEWKRTLDLSALAPFTEKGRHRVQVTYSSGRVADPKRKEWAVRLASPVVEIEVR